MPGDKKLLYVINHMDWFWSHRLPLAKGAQDDGWNVFVCATGASHDDKLQKNGFHGLELPNSGSAVSPFAFLGIIFAIRGIIKREKPDLLHAITLKYAFFAGLAALGTKTKIVHTLAGLGYLFSGESVKPKLLRLLVGPLLKLSLKGKTKQIIFQNPDDMQVMMKRGFVDAKYAHLIKGSGVDIAQFPFIPETDHQPPVVVMPTRLVHDKGVQVFIDAARILKAKGINASFEIAGGAAPTNPLGISEAEMKDMVQDGAVEWLGKVSDMPGLLANSNLIVYPSYYGEGIPKVLLESASTGRAIVTTDHPGCREAVHEGVNGLLVPVKDSEATAKAIETLLNDHTMRAAMGQKSRERAEKEFAVSIIVQMTLSVYNAAFVS